VKHHAWLSYHFPKELKETPRQFDNHNVAFSGSAQGLVSRFLFYFWFEKCAGNPISMFLAGSIKSAWPPSSAASIFSRLQRNVNAPYTAVARSLKSLNAWLSSEARRRPEKACLSLALPSWGTLDLCAGTPKL
jgi:hypothetical protein